ncbi:lytic polysaccharide monooxygenase auxiliary activity family 9 protein [Streptomyces apocyni]|uniref:lytic polysaccharide monooxygenase auxiliary activity family 9 protein n=1 Tax=Streptomyces apocyni TaxID=2654677 RepID=UPI0012E9BC84|nr:lytic polysaccharide monooxygenase [Streptomyces apocyni]
MRKKVGAALFGATVIALSSLATGSASSHGYTDSPLSRQKHCANRTVAGCGGIQWEPQSVEGPKGFPGAGPADGRICSGANTRFGELDAPRTPNGGAWPATNVTGGQGYTFHWTLTAAHATTDFRYYITKDGWNQNAPLTRAALETQPFMTVPYGGQRPPYQVAHQGTIPTQKSGRHIILAVWTIADTQNAFYACSDVRY